VVAASPPLGGFHVNVTELPEDEATRLRGALGAVAAALVTPATRILGLAKHDAPGDPERQLAKKLPGDTLVSAITPKPCGLRRAGVGAEGAPDDPQLTKTTAAAMRPTKPTRSWRMCASFVNRSWICLRDG